MPDEMIYAEHKSNLVLIADDDFFMRSLVKQALDGKATLFEAEDGEQVVEAYKAHSPHVLLLDIHLPKRNGKAVLEELMKYDPQAYIVMLSADSVAENVLQTTHQGAKGFISKPFTKDTILKYVSACPKIKF